MSTQGVNALDRQERGWAVVTGASSGIGAAFARALERRGHPLLLVARRRERLDALARTLRGAEVLAADLGDEAEVERVAAHAQKLGDVELLVNNAGFGSNGSFLALDGRREIEMVKLNTLAPLVLAQRLLPSMIAQRRGGIINISSIAAFQPVPFMATYGGTKAFVLAWSEALTEELRGSGVRVLAVCPGPVRTEFFAVSGVNPALGKMPQAMGAEELVTRALDAFDDGRAVLVPGFINWLTAMAPRFFPRLVVRIVSGKLMAPSQPPKRLRS
jgi:short-subunit dehydrogenase